MPGCRRLRSPGRGPPSPCRGALPPPSCRSQTMPSSEAMKNRLPDLRAARNLTQGDLAEALNVSRQTVNAIETGRYDPSLPLAFAIARLFKCKIEEVFSDRK